MDIISTTPISVFETQGHFDQKLLRLFELDDKNQKMVNIFLKPKHIVTYDDINQTINKKQILSIITDPFFIKEVNKKIKFYLSIFNEDGEKSKRLQDLLKDLHEVNSLSEKYKDDRNLYLIDSSIISNIVKKTELLGDVILYLIVDELIKSLGEIEYQQCKNKLKNFLNSNLFLYNVIKKLAPFNLADIFPDRFETRLAKRSGSERSYQENLIRESKCIDFKYYSNLFEQIIGYLFIISGYKQTKKIFENVIKNAGFIPKDFIKNCIENKKPYDGMILQPGCSCKDEKGKRVCDNPGYYDTRTFKNGKCPSECSEDIEIFINSERNIQNHILYSLSFKDRENLFKSIITHPPPKFFSTYVFQNRQYNSKEDTYLYPIFKYLIDHSKRLGLSIPVVDLLENLIHDMNVYYSEYFKLSDRQYLKKSIDYLVTNQNVFFPIALAVINRYMNLFSNMILTDEKDYWNKILDSSFSKYISDYKNKIQPKFTIGDTNPLPKKESSRPTAFQTQKQNVQEQRGRERVEDTINPKIRSRSRSRSRSREKKTKHEAESVLKIDIPETQVKNRSRSPRDEESTSKRLKPLTIPTPLPAPSPAPSQVRFNIGKKVANHPPPKRSTPRHPSKK
jgi:hypothetical protein